MGRSVTRTHQHGAGELHQPLDCLHGCGCQWLSLLASTLYSNCAHLQHSKSASSSHHQQTGSFQSHQQTTGWRLRSNAEKCEMSRLKQQNFIVRCNSTKRGDEVSPFHPLILLGQKCEIWPKFSIPSFATEQRI